MKTMALLGLVLCSAAGCGGEQESARVSSSLHCAGPVTGVATDRSVWFAYDATEFSDGILYVTGSVRDPDREVSGSALHEPLAVALDEYGAANGGTWILAVDRGLANITYVDADFPGGMSITYVMPAEDCATR